MLAGAVERLARLPSFFRNCDERRPMGHACKTRSAMLLRPPQTRHGICFSSGVLRRVRRGQWGSEGGSDGRCAGTPDPCSFSSPPGCSRISGCSMRSTLRWTGTWDNYSDGTPDLCSEFTRRKRVRSRTVANGSSPSFAVFCTRCRHPSVGYLVLRADAWRRSLVLLPQTLELSSMR